MPGESDHLREGFHLAADGICDKAGMGQEKVAEITRIGLRKDGSNDYLRVSVGGKERIERLLERYHVCTGEIFERVSAVHYYSTMGCDHGVIKRGMVRQYQHTIHRLN